MKKRLLDTAHSLTHWRQHISHEYNEGYVWDLVEMFTTRKIMWAAVLWCPVCTLTALWLWLRKRHGFEFTKLNGKKEEA